jgi:two-component sensor histidine kinase
MPKRLTQDDRLSNLLSRVPAFQDKLIPPSPTRRLLGYVYSIAIAALATVIRFAIEPLLPPGFPYLTFFPAVIITGFFIGMRPAILSALLCGIAAWYWFIAPANSFALSAQSITALAFYAGVVAVDLGLLQLALVGYRAQRRTRDALAETLQMQQVVSDEVDHRMKNLLATVSGLISLSKRHAATPADLANNLQSRIMAMGESVKVLRGSLHSETADISDTLRSGLSTLGLTDGERLVLDGPRLALNGTTVVALNLIMHELGTNAIKYGALTSERGRVRIEWSAPQQLDDRRIITLNWMERNGPPPQAPTRRGFGSELVTRMSASLGDESAFDYSGQGLTVQLRLDAERVLSS